MSLVGAVGEARVNMIRSYLQELACKITGGNYTGPRRKNAFIRLTSVMTSVLLSHWVLSTVSSQRGGAVTLLIFVIRSTSSWYILLINE